MDWVLFLSVLISIESGGDINAVGDRHLRNQAYGVCQIRQPYLDDVNRIEGTNYTMQQVRESESLSRWCVVVYIRHYGKRYTRITGQPLTFEVAARMHNGGPNGWNRSSTDKYWNKFQKLLHQNNLSGDV
jgi:hypothetical protein